MVNNVKLTQDVDEIESEYHRIHHQYLLVLSAAVTLLVVGATVYHNLLHLKWLDAFYFCTITLGTVGYGDISPTTDASKIFTMFYIVIGIGIFATFASLLVRNSTLRRELRRAKRRKV